MSKKVEIYILTHKKFNESFDNSIYFPLLNGSYSHNDDFGYIRDDTGNNISKLNDYFAELTGEYWVWKNSDADIVGFCHYRRWFVKNLKYEKITEKDILNDLNEYDIILPQKTRLSGSIRQITEESLKNNPDYGVKLEDYEKLTQVIKNYFPEYYESYKKHINGNYSYNNNMFICYKNLADSYFEWAFDVIDKLKGEIDFSKYSENNKRVFGFVSEHLLSVFVLKHRLRIKEYYVYLNERKFPFIHFLNRRFPMIQRLESGVYSFLNKNVFIIAEIGVNHNGSVELAKKMIKSAGECGVDAVKFQTFNSEDLVTENAETAGYQEKNTNENSQLKMLKKLELTFDDFKELKDYALKNGVIFISSPFDVKSVDLLEILDVPLYKLGSGELNNFELIDHVQKTNKPIIISTGMATLDEIKETYDFIENKDNLIILHCITGYPTSFEEANLNFIKTLKLEFDVPIGFSDHSPGIELPIAAVALGACVVEKHFTLDKNLEGPDHKASLNPKEFKAMVDAIRNVEVAMGDGIRKFSDNELEIKKVARKSIVLNQDVKKGTKLQREMLSIKRPGTGIPPKFINDVIGKETIEDLKSGTIILWGNLK